MISLCLLGCPQVISISLEQVVQCAGNATGPHGLQSVQTGQGAIMQPVCNTAQRDSTSAPPLIVGATNRVDTMHVPLQLDSFRELMSGPDAAAKPESGPITIYLRARGRHTPFVCAYVVVLTLMCVALGLYLLVAALDQAFVRPRALKPSAINCFAGGCGWWTVASCAFHKHAVHYTLLLCHLGATASV
jgi:hypothetical protein